MLDSFQHQMKIEFITDPGEIFNHRKLELYKISRENIRKKKEKHQIIKKNFKP